MKFSVTRTSRYWGKPCNEAKKVKATYLDRRAVKSLEEAKKYSWFEEWYNSTVNHREENGYIIGEWKEKWDIWVVEINSLKDLLRFIDKYGQVVIQESDYKEYPYEIEIYDTWRE